MKRSYKFTSAEDRRRIVECARRGDDLKTVSQHLNIKIKTCRAIAATDREVAGKPGSSKSKFTPEFVTQLCKYVDDNPCSTLTQIKEHMDRNNPTIAVSTSSINRLLDGHHYSMKKVTIQPTERNTEQTKQKRVAYAGWLKDSGCTTLRLYIDETNYNIWCSRSRGRSRVAKKCVRSLPSSRGPNLNIMACCYVGGVLRFECHDKITWHIFNQFLSTCSAAVAQQQPGVEAVFIFDNAPIHRRACEAELCNGHTFKNLPPYSPFFNPIEEVFSKFKQVSESEGNRV